MGLLVGFVCFACLLAVLVDSYNPGAAKAHGRERPKRRCASGMAACVKTWFAMILCSASELAEHLSPEAKRGVASLPCRMRRLAGWLKERKRGPPV